MHNILDSKNVQYHTELNSDMIGRYVILPGDPKRCEKIAKHFDNAVKVADCREFCTYTGYIGDEKVSVCSTGIGGPSAAIALQELVACGAHTFIRVGTSGGIREDVMGGDIAISTGSIRQEGTSREYCPIEFPAVANLDCTNALVQAAKNLNRSYKVGVTQSKDAFYGQHSPELLPNSHDLMQKWDAWVGMHAVATEMESAALFIVGQYLQVRVGACFLVNGNQERAKKGLSNPIVLDTETAIEVAVEAIRLLIEQDRKEN